MKNKLRFILRKIVSFFLYITGILHLSFLAERKKMGNGYIRVINYHDVSLKQKEKFIKQLRWINKYFNFISFDDFKKMLNDEPVYRSINKPSLLLTFDDGRSGNFNPLLSILCSLNIHALFFVCPGLIGRPGYMTLSQLKQCLNSGYVDIGSHTYNHTELNASISSATAEIEIVHSRTKLKKLFASQIESFCWPYGNDTSYSEIAMKYIKIAGYSYSFCTFSDPIIGSSANKYLIPRTNIQTDWNRFETLYQLSPIHDSNLKNRKNIVTKIYERASKCENNYF